ncbi:MAG TPA: 3-hydroxyacyl-ACP dehydratase [Agriterribacter sp.]|nr:3-hydroxyacyl-ACP dehydratase [Agriterribacter sp.]
MILKDDFYSIIQLTDADNTVQATLQLNPAHRIFEGHFPGQPVVPGVCMIQMVKELLEMASGKTLMLNQADSIKFLSVINPVDAILVQAQVQYSEQQNNELQVTASLHCEERICLKLKAVFIAST